MSMCEAVGMVKWGIFRLVVTPPQITRVISYGFVGRLFYTGNLFELQNYFQSKLSFFQNSAFLPKFHQISGIGLGLTLGLGVVLGLGLKFPFIDQI